MGPRIQLVDSGYNAVGQTVCTKSLVFAGGTTNALGDENGTADPYTIFTVTGKVIAKVFGVCVTGLSGASATIEVGVASQTAGIIAQTTATNMLAGEMWTDATPTLLTEAIPSSFYVPGNIILTVSTANITAGEITMYCLWEPLTAGSNVVAGTGSQTG